MPTEPRPASAPAADDVAAPDSAAPDSAALAFAAADSVVEPEGHSTTADTSAHDLQSAREQRIRRVLDFEGGWTSHGGAKARAIRAEFGWTTTRYYQVLDGLLETPEALRHDPMLVRRLLRVREGR
ncbi:DUF3263 domain-containing protein [Agrococcus sp. Marseille-Q4369]|uniref:DUF3263 domain-containing protein n=1 Tax=Agrococcus sp. Marseille-Q4369 TaxID=2810513 RepID=UPI001B8CC66B|nr:DUF3263 domain-containing protein [Agrococcus sp. Marseille-Q4369]QUW19869.1 DUF3263 domain-containing protein [Agrococcus sp. Marseille-Q4369]